MLVRSRRMNKKLIASLLALGLVFGPVTGAINETYAAEASTNKNISDNSMYELSIIKTYLRDYEDLKKTPEYKLSDNKTQEELDKLMDAVKAYLEKSEITTEELSRYIISIKEAKDKLPINAKANQDNLKASIIKADKVISNNVDYFEKEEYKSLAEKSADAKNILKKLTESDIDGDRLIKLSEELEELTKYAIKEFGDTNEYKGSTNKDLQNLDKELVEEGSSNDEYTEGLADDINKIITSHEDFVTKGKYIFATEEEKKAYDNAVIEYNKLAQQGLNTETYRQILAGATKLAQAKYIINGENPGYKAIRLETRNPNEEKEIIEALNKLREFVNTRKDITNGLTNDELKNKFEENVGLAYVYVNDYRPGNEKSLQTYQELVAYLTKLKNEINKIKGQTPGPPNKDAVKKGLEDLINRTKGIAIDDFYGTVQKDAKESYIKNRDEAIKAKDNKDASLDDLSKAYENFNNSIKDLNNYLRSNLQKIVDEDKDFRESDKFKKADENLIKSYDELIKKANEDIKKPSADANELNLLYKKLVNTKREINGEISSQARKLKNAIIEGKIFMRSDLYLKASVSSDKWRKTAAENYKKLFEKAENLDKEGKLDGKLAEEILDALTKSKDFIEGKLDETKFKNNYYYYTLKAVSEREEFKSVGQVARDRLLDALKMYIDDKEEDAKILSALETAFIDAEIQKIIEKMKEEANPISTRDKLLIDLTSLINEDKSLKEGGFKYQKSQKALRDAYDLALKEANELIADNKNPSEDEVRKAYKKLLDAKNNLDGDKFDELKNNLAARFKKEQLKIANPQDRKAIAEKINALTKAEATMDDALKVEKEFEALINQSKTVTTTTIAPQSQAPAGQVPTTTRPISTVTNPGSIVKTGINGIAKVAAVLAVAAIILKLTSKKGEKDETNK